VSSLLFSFRSGVLAAQQLHAPQQTIDALAIGFVCIWILYVIFYWSALISRYVMKLKTMGIRFAMGFLALCLLFILLQAGKIARSTKGVDYLARPFERIKDQGSLKILFLGDSTAVGVGSPSPQTSTAGWFSRDFPDASIENISQNGLKLCGLREKLKFIQGDHYDLIVVQIGANDIMRLTPLSKIDGDVRFILESLRKKSRQIVLLHSGDVGTAPIFIWPFSWILSQRSYALREIYQKAVKDNGALYVDLIRFNADQVFISDPKKYYAPDSLHLSASGYYVWYQAIRITLTQAGVKFK